MTTNKIDMTPAEFRQAGYVLVDRIADFLGRIRQMPVTRGEQPSQLRVLLGQEGLPIEGKSPGELLEHAADLVLEHSLLNGHPQFYGYITASAAPIGALADLLAAAVNPNVGAQVLSPVATEIERQTILWLAQFIGLPTTWGGLLVSGGNMANLTGFLTGWQVKNNQAGGNKKWKIYCSHRTHIWIEKAVLLCGTGKASLQMISTGNDGRIDIGVLESTIREDVENGFAPLMIIGSAGDVSTGAVDDLAALGTVAATYSAWYHIDGAYGMPAACLPGLQNMFRGRESADSIALDPHKWLYSALEAGCTLVKDPRHLVQTFSSHPSYFNFEGNGEEQPVNYYEYGLQNSRGFRALKVWLGLQQAGLNGYRTMIAENIRLSRLMFQLADSESALEAVTQNLSITTFRFIPAGTEVSGADPQIQEQLNRFNEKLLNQLQQEGNIFLSHGLIDDKYCLRACVVNFRTTEEDIRAMIATVVMQGNLLLKTFPLEGLAK
ncbi:pyridoxal phosphate-dependent decarboxylase family protein [Flavihumibacter petaseus]|uniref:Putative aromatic L-amino acid decarboxylase n=1 Tax=Flavihumibacter petaseus NBRC 106054 TaxID=1220578 RepID=A0A0E9MZS3_9BACT|nr:pyridoxal-dependent decarboxylase [Flavihumibacter petaseus]GAO42630.1 putative aromatic L-amino acid decarboxylase [Flavihumibacter petaseus NBRC 106054]